MPRHEEHRLSRYKAAERRGRRSETLAVALLLCKFYRVLARRVRNAAGEIDLVAKSPRGILCFIEVKARGATDAALESVGVSQQRRIARAAEAFLAARPRLGRHGVRFDVIALAPRGLPRHIQDAWRP